MAKTEVWQGTLALMILRTLEMLGPLHGYGLARRIEQTSDSELVVLYGTIYPALVKLEQDGFVTSEWGVSANHRRAKYLPTDASGPATGAEGSARVAAHCGHCEPIPEVRGIERAAMADRARGWWRRVSAFHAISATRS